MLSLRYRGWEQYRERVRRVIDRLLDALSNLRGALEARLWGDVEAVAATTRDELSTQRYARKMLHRMSATLAYALLCETAAKAHEEANSFPAHSALRFYEEIEPQAIGSESDAARQGVLELLEEESPRATEKR